MTHCQAAHSPPIPDSMRSTNRSPRTSEPDDFEQRPWLGQFMIPRRRPLALLGPSLLTPEARPSERAYLAASGGQSEVSWWRSHAGANPFTCLGAQPSQITSWCTTVSNPGSCNIVEEVRSKLSWTRNLVRTSRPHHKETRTAKDRICFKSLGGRPKDTLRNQQK